MNTPHIDVSMKSSNDGGSASPNIVSDINPVSFDALSPQSKALWAKLSDKPARGPRVSGGDPGYVM